MMKRSVGPIEACVLDDDKQHEVQEKRREIWKWGIEVVIEIAIRDQGSEKRACEHMGDGECSKTANKQGAWCELLLRPEEGRQNE